MPGQEFRIRVEQENTTAVLYPADSKSRLGITLILGHGAGAGQSHPFMRYFATGLADRGIDVVTFNFLYMENGRKVPDKQPKLDNCYRAVIREAQKQGKLKRNALAIGGKSMGGRIASHVAAGTEGEEMALAKLIDALVFLGYPLHPPGKPEQLRAAHLSKIQAPMLFVQGSRDAFGTPDELAPVVEGLKSNVKLHVIPGGDHSFKVPKGSGLSQHQVYDGILDEIASWLPSQAAHTKSGRA